VVGTYRPERLADALDIRRRYAAVPFAGGTDIMVKLRRGAGILPDICEPVLFLDRCRELKRISVSAKHFEIGGAVTFSDLLSTVGLHPAFREAIQSIGAPAIRNVATIGGNICNASPAADVLPFLHAVDARIKLKTADSQRLVPVDEFVTGPGETVLADDELLVSVQYDAWEPDVFLYQKVGTRKANALTKVSFLGLAEIKGGRVGRAAIALGAVGPKVIRLTDVERELAKLAPGQLGSAVDRLRRQCATAVAPIDDQRSTKRYRALAAENLLTHFLTNILMEHL